MFIRVYLFSYRFLVLIKRIKLIINFDLDYCKNDYNIIIWVKAKKFISMSNKLVI